MTQVTNANDVELILQADDGDTKRGTTGETGRIVVDEFTITREEDDSLVSGVGNRHSLGITNGDITHSFSFTIMGHDLDTFDMVATADGRSRRFSMTARKFNEDDEKEFEVSLPVCKATNEEWNASTGDAMEYPVEGIALVKPDETYKSSGTDSTVWSS
jgi:hypothetical protein